VTPYIAILKDSFRDAIASRVLWILLICSTFLLLAVAGFAFEERPVTEFSEGHIYPSLLAELRTQAAKPDNAPIRRIWALFDEATKKRLSEQPHNPSRREQTLAKQTVAAELNALLARRDLYDPAAWSGITLESEASELLARGIDNLSSQELARFNRLALEAAFPADLSISNRASLYISYWGETIGPPLQFNRSFLIKAAVHVFVRVIVGMLGIFCSIIVTASIVPQTFDTGAIDLLLSKPISRSLLYLTKFVGGCSFTLLTAVYILGGVWLLVGWRHGIWLPSLLWCIPVFVFVFAVYYSVSALAGVIWRNTIVSIVVTILFWGLCWSLGALRTLVLENFLIEPARPIRVLTAGDDLVMANARGQIMIWNEANGEWVEILKPEAAHQWHPYGQGLPIVGPVYDSAHERLIAQHLPRKTVGLLDLGATSSILIFGDRGDKWQRQEENRSIYAKPIQLDRQSRLIAVGYGGVGPAFVRQTIGLQREQSNNHFELLGIEVYLPFDRDAGFAAVGPELRMPHPWFVSIAPGGDAIATYNRDKLTLFALGKDDRYAERMHREIQNNGDALVSLGTGIVMLCTPRGEIQVYSTDGLSLRKTFEPEPGIGARFIEVSPDGKRFAIVLHNRTLWIYDAETNELTKPNVAGQGDIAAAGFHGNDQLLVGDKTTRVSRYSLPEMALVQQVEGRENWMELFYRYLVRPLHTVFPKPTELDDVVRYLVTGQRTVMLGPRDGDLQTRQAELDFWIPLWSNLGFIVVMLTIGCVYTSRKDF